MLPIDPNKLSNTTLVKKPKRVKLPAVSIKGWNKIASHVENNKFSYAVRQPKFLHPWSVISAWLPVDTKVEDDLSLASLETSDAEGKEKPHAWHLQVMPGFINGTPPRLSVKAKNASMYSRLRIEQERKAAGKTKDAFPTDEQVIDVPLTELPYYEMSSDGARFVGFGAEPALEADLGSGKASFENEKIPEVFKAMGVVESNTNIDISASAGVKVLDGEPVNPKDIRLLRAIDVVLKMERASLKFDTTIGNPFLDGYSQLVTPRYARMAPTRRYAEVMFVSGPWKPPPEFTLEELEGRGGADPEYDYVKLATVYFISPFAPENEKINGQWQVEVKYDQFWNLCYMPAEIPPMLPPEPIRIITPLGGGFIGGLFNSLLAPLNDGVSRFLAQLRAKRLYGKFWST